MLTAEIKNYIDRSVLCWLATASKKGIPNVSPKEAFTYHGDAKLLIANIASPQSLRNIEENEQVCVSFIDIFLQKGYQLKGKARIVKKAEPGFETLLDPLLKLAGDRFPIPSLTEVRISSVKPIIAPSYLLYPETREKEQIESALKSYKVQLIKQ
jgi:predicted pyridoxine 5'-phosphate oxidase superfamily flavin-nucleotide-binding protein